MLPKSANSTLTLLYWKLGERIRREVLRDERAEYGEQIVATLSHQLVRDYGKGFTEKSLRRMVQFSEAFPDEQIVATLSRELSWSHFVEILPLKQPLEREYYAEMCRIERWSVRTLRERIGSQLYLRTAIAKKARGGSTGRNQPPACWRANDARHGVPRSLHAGFSRLARGLQRTRPSVSARTTSTLICSNRHLGWRWNRRGWTA
jgi:hypothetical protein